MGLCVLTVIASFQLHLKSSAVNHDTRHWTKAVHGGEMFDCTKVGYLVLRRSAKENTIHGANRSNHNLPSHFSKVQDSRLLFWSVLA